MQTEISEEYYDDCRNILFKKVAIIHAEVKAKYVNGAIEKQASGMVDKAIGDIINSGLGEAKDIFNAMPKILMNCLSKLFIQNFEDSIRSEIVAFRLLNRIFYDDVEDKEQEEYYKGYLEDMEINKIKFPVAKEIIKQKNDPDEPGYI